MKIQRFLPAVVFLLTGILFPHPGHSQYPGYFQQRCDIQLSVTLDDQSHWLRNGKEEILYTNNSPDTLKEIWFHLWPNAYGSTRTALAKQLFSQGDFYMKEMDEEDFGFIDSLDFTVDGLRAMFAIDSLTPDIGKLKLNTPLLPGTQCIISTPFRVKIPDAYVSRFGHIDQSYRITQWYPKPAVYDCYGWHAFSYLDQGEFYSEFGNMTVSITLPENYVVAASGELQTESEKRFLDSLSIATKKLLTFVDNPAQSPRNFSMKTIVFKAASVHDFAWFADKRFLLRKNTIPLESGKKVDLFAFFLPDHASGWLHAIQYMEDGIRFYSKCLDDYPYAVASAVDGGNAEGGGMEYPGVVSIGNFGVEKMFEEVLVHELGHIWIYGSLGSNERENPWMDEGINTYYEHRYMTEKYAGKSLSVYFNDASWTRLFGLQRVPFRRLHQIAVQSLLRKKGDRPVNLSSEKYTASEYSLLVYMKTALIFRHVETLLGKETFDRSMRNYYRRFCFRHPYPVDLRGEFEKVSGQNLGWYFDTLMRTDRGTDFKISRLKRSEHMLTVSLVNRGGQNVPLMISYVPRNKDTLLFRYPVGSFSNRKSVTLPYSGKGKLILDYEYSLPETNVKNNDIRTYGLFRRAAPLRFRFLGEVEDPYRSQIFFAPAFGFNCYDGAMAGVSFYNSLFPFRWLNWNITPLYSFKTQSLAGTALLEFSHSLKMKTPVALHFSLPVRSFAYDFPAQTESSHYLRYLRVAPQFRVTYGKKLEGSAESVYLRKEEPPNPYTTSLIPTVIDRWFLNYKLAFKNQNPRQSLRLLLNLEQGKFFLKSSVTAELFFPYSGKRKGFSIRTFAGYFLQQQWGFYGNHNFRMAGWQGSRDYQYEGLFPGRSESAGLWSHQFMERDGAFKVMTYLGQSNNWLVAVNLKAALPLKIPLGVFADFGTYTDAKNIFPGSNTIPYDAGVMLTIIRNGFEIYFPLLMSADIKENSSLIHETYFEKIRFTLSLEKLSLLKAARNIDF